LEEFEDSNEVNELLPEFFDILHAAKNLEKLQLRADSGYDIVLGALLAAKFTRNVVALVVDPHDLTTIGPQSQWNSPRAFAYCVKGLQLRTGLSSLYERDEAGDGTRSGVHVRDFRPTTPQLTLLLSALIAIEELEILGCRSFPELRLCHGCDDLFARSIASMRYPQLRKLQLNRILISGGRLRAFIKHHGLTLNHIVMSYVTLTDGSWRSVAQGLAKLPFITRLYLEHLHQKRRSDRHERPRHRSSTERVFLDDATNIKSFLEIFVAHFYTVERLSRSRVARSYPKYHEVMLFEMPEAMTRMSLRCSETEAELLRYVQMS
jgi:hypothetical protein